MRAAPAEQRPAARAGDAAVGRPARGGTREESIFLDEPGLRLDDLLAAVVAVGGDVVAQVRLARGRVGRQLLRRQRVVRTTLAAAGEGNAGFLHSHGSNSGKNAQLSRCCFFSAASAENGLARPSSSADTGQSRPTDSEPGITGTTGMARI